MLQQQKILRVFRLIKLLIDKPRHNAKELARTLETSEYTIYRYINLLESLGYTIDHDEHFRYFIFEPDGITSTFEIEEMELLNNIIGSIDSNNPLKQSLLKKVYMSSPLVPFANDLIDKGFARIVSLINLGIKAKKQIKLINYQSASSNTIKDRIVEPISFVKASSQLCAFDVGNQIIKHFKVKRITDIEILETEATHNNEIFPTDIFGFTGSIPIKIELQLSQISYKLLIEEYPESKIFTKIEVQDEITIFSFDYEVRSFIGIGRFILGLPNDIIVKSPSTLIDYLNLKMKNNSFAQVANEGI